MDFYKFELDKTNINVTEGEIRTLSLSNEFAEQAGACDLYITWSSSNEDVVSIHRINGVNEGIVLYMLKRGSAVVTATTSNGTSAYCNVTVEQILTVDDLTNMNYYFGDLHSHTGFSDGKGTPESAYIHVKESGKAHFLAVTDHRFKTDRNWFLTIKHADMCTDESFVAIPSYEGGGYMDSYVDEHGINVVNGGEIVYFNTPEAYNFQDTVSKKNYSIGMFAHPQEAGWPTEYIWNSFNNFESRIPEADKLMKLVEVVNETSAYNSIHEYSYALALDKGWHISPTGVSDTHSGGWTTDFNCRTVVIAPKLSRAYIYDAMRNNRVYASEDTSTFLSFKINEKMMGQILNQDVNEYVFYINVFTPKIEDSELKIKKIEIFSDYGQVVYSEDFDSHDVKVQTVLISDTARYYYVRTINAQGKKTWSSAIWTGRPADPIVKIVKGKAIDKSNWQVKWVSSQKNNSAKNIFDGDVRVGWEAAEPTCEIIIDLGKQYDLSAIGYYRHLIPYENREEIDKLLKDYEYYISLEGECFGEPVAKGTVKNYGSEHYTSFNSTCGRYIKVKGISSVGGGLITIGEIFAYQD